MIFLNNKSLKISILTSAMMASIAFADDAVVNHTLNTKNLNNDTVNSSKTTTATNVATNKVEDTTKESANANNTANTLQDNLVNNGNDIVQKTLDTLEPGDTVYVSDKNIIWLRRGPSTAYKIIGQKTIGEPLSFIEYSNNKEYIKAQDSEGLEFWVKKGETQLELCGPLKEKELQDKIASLEYELEHYDSTLKEDYDKVSATLEKLTKENAKLKSELKLKEENLLKLDEIRRDLSDKLETKELDMQMRWWVQGAMIGLIGAILGAILIYIPRPGKKAKRNRF